MHEGEDLPAYEVFAIKYAESRRPARELYFNSDPHEACGAIDYFVWLIRGHGRTVLVDTGFGQSAAAARGRTLLRSPTEALDKLGSPAHSIEHVILTHLHYDHAGNLQDYPNARFILQEREMIGATGPDMCHHLCRRAFNTEDVLDAVRLVHSDRVAFINGDYDVAPGISLHLLGGHTRGLQGVRVYTKRGWVMLGSDALHFYRNLEEADPFPVFTDLPGVLDAGRRALALAGDLHHLIPGHDPLVLERFARHTSVSEVAILSEPPVETAADTDQR